MECAEDIMELSKIIKNGKNLANDEENWFFFLVPHLLPIKDKLKKKVINDNFPLLCNQYNIGEWWPKYSVNFWGNFDQASFISTLILFWMARNLSII